MTLIRESLSPSLLNYIPKHSEKDIVATNLQPSKLMRAGGTCSGRQPEVGSQGCEK